tara:strand:+ start:1783 stop:2127 length:345 start_codon:yes stop_codon:yes gene_type:complete
MSKTRIIYDSQGKLAEWQDNELIWSKEAKSVPSKQVHVIRDIDPYKSMVTGEMISSRSQHRDHLRRHNCIEIGNEKMESKPIQVKQNRREFLHRQLSDMSDRQANKILKELRGR